ncbi:MAG TPA: YbaB/EbfC family nucleoid-associated protein, partial [Acidimicrobiales bacterium]|nr:YbaB/EbfC family nucleoid-associated protein [Acidimicrobiales bacterium]
GQVQQNIAQAQEAAAAEEVEGSAGGGSVKVTVNGAMEFLSVKIDPSVVDRDDVEMLEDLVLAAVRDALEKAAGLASNAIKGAGLPGMGGAGGLGDLFGGLLGGEPPPSEIR